MALTRWSHAHLLLVIGNPVDLQSIPLFREGHSVIRLFQHIRNGINGAFHVSIEGHMSVAGHIMYFSTAIREPYPAIQPHIIDRQNNQ